MDTKTFRCSECGYNGEGPIFAYSMSINCPSCGNDTTAYPTN